MVKKKIPKARLFVSIPVPESIQQTVSKVTREVKKLNLIEAKWVQEKNYHITLHFLGYVPIDLLPDIKEQLAMISFKPFSVALDLLEVNDRKNPRVLWISLKSELLIQLAHEIITNLSLFIEPEERGFHPHLTLARIKKVHNQEGVDELLDDYDGPQDNWMVNSFSLMESELSKAGSEYLAVLKVLAINP